MNYLLVGGLIVMVGTFCCTTNALDMPEKLKKHAKKIHAMCQKESGVPEELIQQASTGNIPDDRQMQCYLYCLFDKVGLIDPDHVIRLENLLEMLPADLHSLIRNLVEQCGTQHGADGCETAFLTVKCYAKADPALFQSTFVMD